MLCPLFCMGRQRHHQFCIHHADQFFNGATPTQNLLAKSKAKQMAIGAAFPDTGSDREV